MKSNYLLPPYYTLTGKKLARVVVLITILGAVVLAGIGYAAWNTFPYAEVIGANPSLGSSGQTTVTPESDQHDLASPEPAASSSLEINQSQEPNSMNNTTKTTISVNGQNIPVPENGTTEQTVPSSTGGGSETKVTIQVQNSSDDSSSSSSHLNIFTHSTNTTTTREEVSH